MQLLQEVIITYILTLIITKASVFNKYRQWLVDKTPWLQKPAMRDEVEPPHYFKCRLCVGFAVSITVCLYFVDISNILLVYGLSYFLATQER